MYWFTLVALLSGVNHVSLQSSTTPNVISDLLEKTVGANYFQEYLKNHTKTSTEGIDGSKSVENLAISLRSKLEERISAVGNIAKFMQNSVNQFTENPGYPECCKNDYQDDLYDPLLRMPIDRREMCVTKAKSSPKSVKSPTVDMLQVFISNRASIPGLMVQYYGSTSGVAYHFPSKNAKDCQSYDPRTRPWYDSTLNKNNKDVVFIIDTSMQYPSPESEKNTDATKSLVNATKQAVLKLISSLNAKDSLLLLPTTDIKPPPIHSCFYTSFSHASDNLKKYLKNYLTVVEGQAQDPDSTGTKIDLTTEFVATLTYAFDKIKEKAVDSSDRNTAIVLLLGGMYNVNKEKVLQYFKTLVTDNYSHVLFLYSIFSYADVETLLQFMKNSYKGEAETETITDIDQWDVKMYTHFELNLEHPKISAPYIDSDSNETVLTVAQPVIIGGILHGVAAIDISLNDLLKDLKTFNAGKKSYSFLYDYQDLAVLTHPMLPHRLVYTRPDILNINIFEKMNLLNRLIDSGGNDSKSSEAKVNASVRVLGRGSSQTHGIIKETVPSTYYCSKINVESTSLVLCLVLANDAKKEVRNLNLFLKLDDIRFFYHNTELTAFKGDQCRTFLYGHFKGKTGVALSAISFRIPQYYLYHNETKDDIEKYTKIMKDLDSNDILTTGVISDVHLTSIIEILWTTNTTLQSVPYTAWRYIATKHGVLRTEPALKYPKAYQPTNTLWYRKATSVPKMTIAFSTPYLDTGGAGFVVTASRAIFEENSSEVFGVMGADFSLHYLKVLVDTTYTDCDNKNYECFLIDEAGYLITHKDWIYSTSTEEDINVVNIHITLLEPEVSNVLIKHGYLKLSYCTDVSELLDYYQYYLDIAESGASYTIDNKPAIKVLPIKNTNIYVVQKALDQFNRATCECGKFCSEIIPGQCECPCSQESNISTCSGASLLLEPPVLCTPKPYNPVNVIDSINEKPFLGELEKLDFCVSADCASHTLEKDCVVYSVCQWCTHTKEGKLLSGAICRNIGHCWFGQVGRKSPYKRPIKEYTSILMPVWLALGVVSVIILLMVVFWLCLRTRWNRQAKERQLENVDKLVPGTKLITSQNIPKIFAHPQGQKRMMRIKAEKEKASRAQTLQNTVARAAEDSNRQGAEEQEGQAAAEREGQAAGGQAAAGHEEQAAAGQEGQAAAGQEGQAAAGQKGQTAAEQEGKAAAEQKGQTAAGQEGKMAAEQEGQSAAGQNSDGLTPDNPAADEPTSNRQEEPAQVNLPEEDVDVKDGSKAKPDEQNIPSATTTSSKGKKAQRKSTSPRPLKKATKSEKK